ncbi:hypothetical protein EUX98_g3991 [Antrodiella citrinella]|uniref:Uncharacterized protein n=1 Tax=Antrodiella citrinella TaxID=2447956 RepID=A0A4S4MW83_9APHY|nr:hypothetical protein EUX98_g3991 [Antrodiella citrinella]
MPRVPSNSVLSYNERRTILRNELRNVATSNLVSITDVTVLMRWSWAMVYHHIFIPHQVMLFGWPRKIEFGSPTTFSSVDVLERLIDLWHTGEIYFRRLSNRQFTAMVENPPSRFAAILPLSSRSDANEKRPVRPPATRSKILKPGRKQPKTSKYVSKRHREL